MKRFTMFDGIQVGLMLIALCGLNGVVQAANQTNSPTLTIDLGGGVKMEFVLIKPGSFLMGSEKDEAGAKPAHKVTISKPFYLGKYEVTQEQWKKVMGSNPSQFKDAKNPVDSVSWYDCQSFITKLKEKASGQKFGLPTEAQWEYACRAGSTGDYCYGDGAANLSEYAWYRSDKTHPVGEKKPNAWGLYDMHGNVREWCADWMTVYSANAETDPTGESSGYNRMLRGGSWDMDPTHLRSYDRDMASPANRFYFLGLRIVAVVGTP